MAYTKEVFRRVYDDNIGTYVEVRPDRDSLGCVEIVCEERSTSFSMRPGQALLVADAIRHCAEELRTENPEED